MNKLNVLKKFSYIRNMLNSGYTCHSSVGSLGLLLVNCKNSTLASTNWCRGLCLCLCRSLSMCSPSTHTSPSRSLYLYCRLGCWGCRLLSILLRAVPGYMPCLPTLVANYGGISTLTTVPFSTHFTYRFH